MNPKQFLKLILIFNFIYLYNLSSAQNNPKYNGLDLIKYEGVPYYVNGLNIPWNYFGGDFGNHEDWGSLYDSKWFENTFKDCKEHGVNVVRIWIHCDGRANPEFDENGYVTGFDPDFFQDMDDMFRLAQKYEVMVMPCLWSFDMCKDQRESAGPYAGYHQDLLTEDQKMESYLQKCFVPMVKRYANQCNLFAWEICNEPEWAMDRSVLAADKYWEYRTMFVVPIEAMQKLTAKMASIVHQYSNKMVTTGSGAIRWNAVKAPSAVVNFWSDEALKSVNNNDPLSYLDFYQIHYYDHFKASGADPYDTTKNIIYWNFDKPVLIGETPASKRDSKEYNPADMPDLALKNGFAGNMYWSYKGSDGVGGWDDFKEANKKFYENHQTLVRPTTFPCIKISPKNLNLKVSTTEKGVQLDWFVFKAAYVEKFEINKLKEDGTYEPLSVRIDKKDKNFSALLSQNISENTLFVIKQKDVYGYENETKPFVIKGNTFIQKD
ncbi:MAG: cellulase family glycosylhydrolase [Cytophagales bacterium]